MTPADVYEPPQSLRTDGLTNIYGDQGTGFTLLSVTDPNGDYGRVITLKAGNRSANDPPRPDGITSS